MPCRSYDDEPVYGSKGSIDTQNKIDMLARIACRALTALETINLVSGNDVKNTIDIGATITAVLDDSEISVWWPKHKAADAAEQIRIKEEAARAEAKISALSKLTTAEKKLLGVG